MQKAVFEKLGVTTSRLGFGCMRFPVTPEGGIDEPRAAAMIDRAWQAGVRYYDTAYFYHNHTSEDFVGRTMERYPRGEFQLATKLPLSVIHSLDEAKSIFEGQLKSLRTEYFDFYLLHALNAARWDFTLENGILDYLLEQQKLGRIRHLGFSFHDGYEVFERILSYRSWDFCQIQFNYMDVDIQAGMKGYELAERLGVPLVIMEPVKGGSLAQLPGGIASILREADPKRSAASYAMRWVGSLPNCRVILSGMTAEDQVEDNIATFTDFEPLTESELALIERVRTAIRAREFVGCTACRYCMPCPFGVDIPGNFKMMNEYRRYENKRSLAFDWRFFDAQERADACRKCGKCEAACPQAIPIRQKLAEIAEFMASQC